MLPSLQPSRPKVRPSILPQQHPLPNTSLQQRRTTHNLPQPPPHQHFNSHKPTSQIEAMPPRRTSPPLATQTFYDAATRHPVFFTSNLRKPPFPIPQMPAHGWSPVASGYVQERAGGKGGVGTKL
ncbi:hypothetical protein SVAN01_08630 [Stagonosporopsis vannaccii]|nr:hypothetical protein SVAN01_08630 [Stagonosporopsis vannaccii]